MIAIVLTPVFAAAGYSLIYLLFGGGLGGAVLIFIFATRTVYSSKASTPNRGSIGAAWSVGRKCL